MKIIFQAKKSKGLKSLQIIDRWQLCTAIKITRFINLIHTIMKNYGREVFHVWANQSANEGKSSNVFFYGNTIYSYGYHFILAQLYKNDNNIVFYNSGSYSNTTSKHQCWTRQAIRHKTIFTLPYPDHNNIWEDNVKRNIDYYCQKINNLAYDWKKSRLYKDSLLNQIKGTVSEANDYIKLVNFKKPTKEQKTILNPENWADIAVNLEAIAAQRIKADKLAQAKQRKEQQKRLNEWLGFTGVKWKLNKIYLRLKDEMIETSQHASVPEREAKILYNMIKAEKDIKGYKIGNYTVIGINGVLKIGCHEIEREEMERIAKLLNW